MRTQRTNGTTTYSYVYNGGQLSQMTIDAAEDVVLNFTYDASGTPLSVNYNGTYYYYVTDLQGDVVAIVDTEGEKVVEYLYDAWGRLLETSGTKAADLGLQNPLRYRGYVYDTESGLYYLQSRYYNPTLGRFINADMSVSTGQGILGNNMFSYCLNNPVNGSDPCGTCFHRLDFWNDCEDCGGKTLGEKLNNIATGIYDYATDVYDAHMMQNEWQRQVDQMSFNAMRDSTTAVWNAHEHSIELQTQQQYQQDMAVRAHVQQSFSTPENTAKTLDRYGWYLEGGAIVLGMAGYPIAGGIVGLLGWGLKGVSVVILENT